jgi:hypothetical protein
MYGTDGVSKVVLTTVLAVSAAVLLSSCGGSDVMTGTTYPFVTPVLNSVRIYSESVIDSSNNTIDFTLRTQITSVNSDGSYTETSSSPDGVNTVDGITYGTTQNGSYNNQGQERSFTYPASSGGTGTCTFDPNGPGPPFPLTVGQTWQLQYTYSCNGNAPTSYSQSGTVVDLESVTVPAGMFNALKLQSTLTWTNSEGTTRQESVTNWRDVQTLQSVKQSITYTLRGTAPTGDYVVSEALELQSTS